MKRRRFSWYAGLGLVISSTVPLAVGALLAEPAGPKDFYPKHYVDDAFRGAGEPPRTKSGAHASDQSMKNSQSERKQESNQGSALSTAPEDMGAPGAREGRAIPIVTVYVNSLDAEHFNQVYHKVIATQKRGRIWIGALMHVGDYRVVGEDRTQNLNALGIAVYPVRAPRLDLPAERSPAWYVMQEGREALIDGYFDIERFFDEKGNFNPNVAAIDSNGVGRPAGDLKGF